MFRFGRLTNRSMSPWRAALDPDRNVAWQLHYGSLWWCLRRGCPKGGKDGTTRLGDMDYALGRVSDPGALSDHIRQTTIYDSLDLVKKLNLHL